jgi:hypothetical protein
VWLDCHKESKGSQLDSVAKQSTACATFERSNSGFAWPIIAARGKKNSWATDAVPEQRVYFLRAHDSD